MVIGPLWITSMVVVSITALLSAGLLYTYVKNYAKARSRFTLGLVLFASAVIVENVIAVYIFIQLAQVLPAIFAIPLIIIHTIGLVGFAILLWVTWRPS